MKSFLIFLAIAGPLVARAAAFRNLGFDEAQTNNVVFYSFRRGQGSVEELLPGWRLYQGDARQTNVFFDGGPADLPAATVLDAWAVETFVEGSYAVEFHATQFNEVPFWLVQNGEIPIKAVVLELRYWEHPFSVSIDGTPIPRLSPLMGIALTPQIARYDVSAFAGKNVELRVTTLSMDPLARLDYHFLDSLRFVNAPVLSATRFGQELILSWSAASGDYVLQSTAGLASKDRWKAVPSAPILTGDEQTVTIQLGENTKYYRLALGLTPQ